MGPSINERIERRKAQLRADIEAWDWSAPNTIYADMLHRRLARIIEEHGRAEEPTQLDRIEDMLKRLLGEADL